MSTAYDTNDGCVAMWIETNQKPFIYVVDDDTASHGLLEGLFNNEEFDCKTYTMGRAFLAAPKEDRPSCAVVDVRLPDINGLDLLAHLRSIGVLLPVVIISGYGDVPKFVRGHE